MTSIGVQSASETPEIASQTAMRNPHRGRTGHYAGKYTVSRGPQSPETRGTARCCIRSKSSRFYIHPFREGNGRAQRAFLDQVAESSGRRLAWRNISQREHTLASIRAFNQGSGEPFRELMSEVIKPPLDGLDPLEPSVYHVAPSQTAASGGLIQDQSPTHSETPSA